MSSDDPTAAAARRCSCARCQRPDAVCVCASLPTAALSTATRILVLQSQNETRRAHTTVPVMQLVLSRCSVVVLEGGGGGGVPPAELRAQLSEPGAALLLFPFGGEYLEDLGGGDDAEGAEGAAAAAAAAAAGGGGRVLVALDGTWREAKKLLAAHPWLAALRRVQFRAPPDGRFGLLRREPQRGLLSTGEAVAYALRLLEPRRPAPAAALLAAVNAMIDLQRAHIPLDEARCRPAAADAEAAQLRAGGARTGDDAGCAGCDCCGAAPLCAECTGTREYVFAARTSSATGATATVCEAVVVRGRARRSVRAVSYDAARALAKRENVLRKRGTRLTVLPLARHPEALDEPASTAEA